MDEVRQTEREAVDHHGRERRYVLERRSLTTQPDQHVTYDQQAEHAARLTNDPREPSRE